MRDPGILDPRHFFSPGTFTRFTRFLHDFMWFLHNFTRFLRFLHDFTRFLRNFTWFLHDLTQFLRFSRYFLPGKKFSIPGTKNYFQGLLQVLHFMFTSHTHPFILWHPVCSETGARNGWVIKRPEYVDQNTRAVKTGWYCVCVYSFLHT